MNLCNMIIKDAGFFVGVVDTLLFACKHFIINVASRVLLGRNISEKGILYLRYLRKGDY